MKIPNLNLSDKATQRELLLKLKAVFPNKSISPSFLRLEQETVNTPALNFTISADTRIINETEQRLQRNDLFIATEIGFFIKKVLSGVHGNSQLYTYPNAIEFADNSTTFLGADLEALYNGSFQFKTGSTVTVEALETQRFRKVPMLAEGSPVSATITSADAVAINRIVADPKGPDDGYHRLDSFLQFLGKDQHALTLNIPDGSQMKIAHTASNTDVFCVLMFRGILVKNVDLS